VYTVTCTRTSTRPRTPPYSRPVHDRYDRVRAVHTCTRSAYIRSCTLAVHTCTRPCTRLVHSRVYTVLFTCSRPVFTCTRSVYAAVYTADYSAVFTARTRPCGRYTAVCTGVIHTRPCSRAGRVLIHASTRFTAKESTSSYELNQI